MVDQTKVKLTEEITKLEDVLHLELVTNPNETCTNLKFKKNELNAAIKKNLVKRNRQNKKLSCDQQKEKNIAGNYIFSRIMFES